MNELFAFIILIGLVIVICLIVMSNRYLVNSINRDIKNMYEKIGILESYSEYSVVGVIEVDFNGVIRNINQTFTYILGWRPVDIVGKSLDIIVPKRFLESNREAFDKVKQGHIDIKDLPIREVCALNKEGHEVPINIYLASWLKEDKRFFMAIIRKLHE